MMILQLYLQITKSRQARSCFGKGNKAHSNLRPYLQGNRRNLVSCGLFPLGCFSSWSQQGAALPSSQDTMCRTWEERAHSSVVLRVPQAGRGQEKRDAVKTMESPFCFSKTKQQNPHRSAQGDGPCCVSSQGEG